MIANQHHFLTHCKDLISQYRKRLDFDYLLCCTKFDEIVQETMTAPFEKHRADIEQLISVLDKSIIYEFEKVFKL